MKTTDYQTQANTLLKELGVKFIVKYLDHNFHFQDDKHTRDIYETKFLRNGESFKVKFGQSIVNNGIEPTAYDVICCLTKNDPGTFEDFCSDFGYDNDSRKAHKTYKAVVKEWEKVSGFFTEDELNQLMEIQ